MPDLDGLALACEIRQETPAQHLPLLLLSSARLRGDDSRRTSRMPFVHSRYGQRTCSMHCRAMSIQLQREKRAERPSLDGTFARRFPLRCSGDDNRSIRKLD